MAFELILSLIPWLFLVIIILLIATKGIKNKIVQVKEDTSFCPACGEAILDDNDFCSECGVEFVKKNNYYNKISNKERLSALLLCFFFGIFGIHRFYVGKTGTGILWLLTFGLLGIGVLFDLIKIIVGSFEDAQGKFIKNWTYKNRIIN